MDYITKEIYLSIEKELQKKFLKKFGFDNEYDFINSNSDYSKLDKDIQIYLFYLDNKPILETTTLSSYNMAKYSYIYNILENIENFYNNAPQPIPIIFNTKLNNILLNR